MSRATRRAERPALAILLTSLTVLIALAAIATTAFRSPRGLPLAQDRTVFAEVPDIGNVRRYNEVRIAGVRVGKVIDRDVVGAKARLELRIDGEAGPLARDTRVAIRGRGLLGQRYVELVPGRSTDLLPDGASLRGDDATLTAGVPDALDTFDADTRLAFGDMIGELGTGVLSRGVELNDTIRVGPKVGTDFLAFAARLAAQDGALARLVPSLDALVRAAEPAAADIAAGLRPAAAALRPFSQEADALRAALTQAPRALGAVRPALDGGRRLLVATRALAVSANRALPPAPAALRETARLLDEAPTPLRRAATLLRETRPAVTPTLRLARAARPVLEPAGRALTVATPVVEIAGRHGCDIDNFAENWRDFLAYAVPGGGKFGPLRTIRIDAISGPSNVAGGGELTQAVTAPDALVERNAYQDPCWRSPGPSYTQAGGRP